MESCLVDEIFFQVPEILGHHELFCAGLKSRLDTWASRQKIGDIILSNVSRDERVGLFIEPHIVQMWACPPWGEGGERLGETPLRGGDGV